MPVYTFKCEEHGEFDTIDRDISCCKVCGREAKRVYKPIGIVWNCDGNVGKIG